MVENIFPTSRFRDTTIVGPAACMFQSFTCLSVDPVAINPGMLGLISNAEIDSSCAWRIQTGLLAAGFEGALRMSW